MKVREFLRSITDPLKLNDQELETALQASALGEIDLPDSLKSKFNENYLTPDRAAADDRVLSKARGAAYAMVEQRMAKLIIPKLKEEDQKAINEAPQLFDKLALMEKAMDNIATAPTEDVKKVQETWRKTEAELRTQIKTFEDDFKKAEETKKSELEGLKMDYALRTKLAGIKLATEFDDDDKKEFLANSTIDFLKRNFVLQTDEKNPGTVHLRRNADGAVVDVYEFEGEKRQAPFTLDDVVKKRYEKFTSKNNAEPDKDKDKQQQQKTTISTPSDKPITLSEMIRQREDAAAATA